MGGVSEQKRGGFVLRAGWKATAAGIYGLRLLLTKRCGRLTPRAVLALDSWPKACHLTKTIEREKALEKVSARASIKVLKSLWKIL